MELFSFNTLFLYKLVNTLLGSSITIGTFSNQENINVNNKNVTFVWIVREYLESFKIIMST